MLKIDVIENNLLMCLDHLCSTSWHICIRGILGHICIYYIDKIYCFLQKCSNIFYIWTGQIPNIQFSDNLFATQKQNE